MPELQTVVHGASELVVGPDDEGSLQAYEDGALAVVDGDVAAVGRTSDLLAEYPAENADTDIDASGQTVIPGFVDPHTHALFAGDRSDEFAQKLRGKPYQEILAEGGGILRTVEAVREASDDELVANLTAQLDAMLAHGTTTAEVKTGYGLDTETELRMLDAVETAAADHPVDVVGTFLGAHAVPDGRDTEDYVDEVVAEQIPAAADHGAAEFCDVFCEEGVFTIEQSRRILEAGREHGLTPKIHAEEFTRLGSAQLAADLNAASADHLLHANREDAEALADADVTPVLLPGTAFSLGEDYADPEQFAAAGAPVALATDLNPNCYSQSMGFAVALACNGMRMAPADALLGATAHAATAIDREDGTGTLREGTAADLVVVDGPSYVHVPYNFGVNSAETVLKDGSVVASGGERA
ncbi:imidazolonepropionase [Halobacterium jilantaiense]|uniref:Imidazolonepropionase n=1 Tax=Halobacterium jilantaiense TaxID=355548 RepID=A0A1I0NAZ8_9EURY|nr:imidazolonepropionase [Halobacterium jilantaiense]SEV98342.1 imidazolonepropionase [Halobacterium jilantaiense]